MEEFSFDNMKIEHFNTTEKGFFKAIDNGNDAGRMTYTWAGADKIIIDHTEVNPEYRGENIGENLVMEAVKFAREKQIKIMPLCTFAKSVFDKNQDIKDVLF